MTLTRTVIAAVFVVLCLACEPGGLTTTEDVRPATAPTAPPIERTER